MLKVDGSRGLVWSDPNDERVAWWVPYAIEASGPWGDYRITIRLDIDEEGLALVVDRFELARTPGGPPVTAKALRSVPLGDLRRQLVERNSHRLDVDEEGSVAIRMFAGLPGRGNAGPQNVRPVLANDPYRQWRVPPGEERTRGAGDDQLRAVAEVYRAALHAGDPPTLRVADVLRLPRSTAGRWVALARQRGLLGAAQPRRAGEAQG